jgi:hypothetical protein
MRKYSLFFALLLIFGLAFVASNANAASRRAKASSQSTQDYQQDAFLQLGGLGDDFGAGLGYEHTIGKSQSLQAQLRVGGWYNLVGVEAGWRFWLGNKKSLRGFYLGPIFGVEFGSWNPGYYGSDSISTTDVFGGVEGGYQWIFKNRMVVSCGASIGYQHLTATWTDTYWYNYEYKLDESGIRLGVKGSIGYAF